MIQRPDAADARAKADGAPTSRRRFMAMAGGMAAVPLAAAFDGPAHAATRAIKAIAFDAFPIFDVRAVFSVANNLFPGRSDELRNIWFQKLFAYTWLRTTARRYAPFDDVIAESLRYAAEASGIPLTTTQSDRLIGAFWMLPAWPDVPERLRALRAQGLRLAFLSNMGEAMLTANMRHNGIASVFEATLSTDRVSAFKPAPEAYALAERELGLATDEIAFAAFAAWDAAGASWFGYPTAWVNRLGQPAEHVGAPKVRAGRDLAVVADLVRELT
jgi:2-haloacid dehalogenase